MPTASAAQRCAQPKDLNSTAHARSPITTAAPNGVDAATIPAPIAPQLAQFDSLPESAHVRLPTVSALHGIGPATVWRWVKVGRLPAPVKLGPNTTAWRVGELRKSMARTAQPVES